MDGPNHVEFTMKKKEDAGIRLLRFGIFMACIMPFLIVTTIVMMRFTQFIVVTAPLIILTIVMCIYTRRFTRIEYEYVIQSGEFSISAIYDNLSRRDLIKNAKISEMQKIVPYKTNEKLLEAQDITKVFYYCSDLEHPDLYLAVFDDEKKGRIAVVFNVNRKLAQVMKFYNSLNTIVKNDFQY